MYKIFDNDVFIATSLFPTSNAMVVCDVLEILTGRAFTESILSMLLCTCNESSIWQLHDHLQTSHVLLQCKSLPFATSWEQFSPRGQSLLRTNTIATRIWHVPIRLLTQCTSMLPKIASKLTFI